MNASIDSNPDKINTLLLVEGNTVEYVCNNGQQPGARSSITLDKLGEDTFLNNYVEGKDTPVVMFVNTFFSLYPADKIIPQNAANALRTTLSRPDEFTVKDERTKFNDQIACIYAVSAKKLERLYRWHLGLKLHHVAPGILSFIREVEKSPAQKQVNLHLFHEHFFISVFDEGELQLAQVFKITSPVDLLYFTLAVYEDLGLDPGSDPLIYSGNISSDGQYYEKLYQYIKYMQPLEVSLDLNMYSGIYSLFV